MTSPLCLDLATKTGWAFGRAGAQPLSGTFGLPGGNECLGVFAAEFVSWLTKKVRALKPSEIVFEAPILPRAKLNRDGEIEMGTTLATVRKLHGLCILTEFVAEAEGIASSEIGSSEWRHPFLGDQYPRKGKRDDFKRAAFRVCRMHGWHPSTDDEAEALGILFVVNSVRNPRVAAALAMKGAV